MSLVLGLGAVALGIAGAWRGWARFRQGGIAVASLGAGLALGAALAPPSWPGAGRALQVLAAGAAAEPPASGLAVRLPEAGPGGGLSVPDLATALRRFPEAGQLVVHGHGLAARDRGAAAGLPLRLVATPLPPGIAELDYPARVLAGHALGVQGRVAGVDGARVELRDPAGGLAASAATGADGRFALSVPFKAPGRMQVELRLLDGAGRLVERAELPVAVVPGRRLALRIEAGGPDPELKFLRRWALDAGLSLGSRLSLSPGLSQGDASWQATASELKALDLLIVDERSWSGLGAEARRRIEQAVGEGLGLLWRVRGPVPAELAATWAAWSLPVAALEQAEDAPFARGLGLSRPLRAWGRIEAGGGQALLRDDGGAVRAAWWPRGQGRVAISLLGDSQALAAGEAPAAFGRHWAGLVGQVARAGADAEPLPPALWRAGEHGRLCGLTEDARWQAPGRDERALVPTGGCAALWPERAGWHTLRQGGRELPVAVLAAEALPVQRAWELRAATEAMAGDFGPAPRRALPAWPFLGLALACLGLSWWLERRSLLAARRPD